ncbi:MAG: hypothetical protein ACREYF_29390 [Gammaproteobacteria bacterium]
MLRALREDGLCAAKKTSLVRRLTVHYPDTIIAGILTRQDRTTAYGLRYSANHVGNLRRHWNIPRFEPRAEQSDGEPGVAGIAEHIEELLTTSHFKEYEVLKKESPVKIAELTSAPWRGSSGKGDEQRRYMPNA